MQNYTLTELIKPNILQQIQDAFSEYSGMASITTDAEGGSCYCWKQFYPFLHRPYTNHRSRVQELLQLR